VGDGHVCAYLNIMLTLRGRFFLLCILVLLGYALIYSTTLSLISLTLLLWFLANWLIFAVHLRLLQPALHLERILLDDRGPVDSLWSGGAFTVHVRVHQKNAFRWSYLRIQDRLSPLLTLTDGTLKNAGPLAPDVPLELRYRIRCAAPGNVRFEGIEVHLADLQGFFVHVHFLRAPQRYRILPRIVDYKSTLATTKKSNLLPLLGVHRHRRPGSGSELLDIRDYIPGDPPKTIAWKASARRGRLMTKEFESEVPIRCTLFMDTSNSVRTGSPGANALARLVEIVAGVSQVSAAARDLTGLCLFDEDDFQYVRPARGPQHLIRLLHLLADAASLPPKPVDTPLDRLLPIGYGLAQEVYPDLLHPDVNSNPAWLPWWSPQPGWTLPRPPLLARSMWRVPVVWCRRRLRFLVLWLRKIILGRFSGAVRRQYRRRKQLAALLAVLHDMGPGGLAALLEDDFLCSRHVQTFLAEHQVAVDTPLYDFQGRYLFAASGKIDVLAKALLRAISRGRDNELFVLMVDLLELDLAPGTSDGKAGSLGSPLLAAIKVALARHHQVMVICPWPHALRAPEDVEEPLQADVAGRMPAWLTRTSESPMLDAILRRTNTMRYNRAYQRLRRQFARLGVPVIAAVREDSVRLILDRLERLRTVGRGALTP